MRSEITLEREDYIGYVSYICTYVSVNNFKEHVWNVGVHASDHDLHHTPHLCIKADNCAYKNHLFVQEKATQKEVVCFLCSVDFAWTLTDAHTKAFRDAVDGIFNSLERELVCLDDFRAISMLANVLPEVFELTSWNEICFDIVSDGNFGFIYLIFILIGAYFFFCIHIYLGDGVA